MHAYLQIKFNPKIAFSLPDFPEQSNFFPTLQGEKERRGEGGEEEEEKKSSRECLAITTYSELAE